MPSNKYKIRIDNTNIFSRFDLKEGRFFYKGMSDLNMLSTNFIKRTYLENMTEFIRMQDLPDVAFVINPENPIFISHPWLTHLLPNNSFLEIIKQYIPNDEKNGIWIDYCCLPQKTKDGFDDRTEKERLFFMSQLQYIPTILLKSQLVVLWNEKNISRAWCLIELLLSDIFKNLIMKQIYHNKSKLSDIVVYFTQTYNPVEYLFSGGVEGTPIPKILLPFEIKSLSSVFYNSIFHQLGMHTTIPITTLLKEVELKHIDRYFEDNKLSCTNHHDIKVLKELLLKVCQFAGNFEVDRIKWDGVISFWTLYPYMLADLSDYSIKLVDYKF